jgi:hypothetical protein
LGASIIDSIKTPIKFGIKYPEKSRCRGLSQVKTLKVIAAVAYFWNCSILHGNNK